ncbi:MAG TPA: GDSL-type esterase/lipase family protein [Solirubrobacteraceae bacterium]|nr:GDSL-type esterase/lipase family protein [Solirubrobacteraceae bacterium]
MARPPLLSELVRFCHPAKILAGTRLPGGLDEAAIAALYGSDAWRDLAAAMDAAAARAAAALPAPPREPVLALGDSITDDLGSWAEILRHAGAAVVNGGLSGDTTAGARVRLTRLLEARPRWAVVLLGTNDARRHGGPMLVSHDETRRNLAAIDARLRRCCDRVVWVTPPPVADPVRLEPDLLWRLDDVAAKAELVRDLDRHAVDLWPGWRPEYLMADGLHPSAAGQAFIARSVARASRPRSA